MKKMIVDQVRELLERHLNALEIANRLGIDITDVQTAIEIIKQIVT